jgi:hypothetical protein
LKAARRLLKRGDGHVTNSSNVAAAATSPQKFYWLASDGWGKQSQVKSCPLLFINIKTLLTNETISCTKGSFEVVTLKITFYSF